MRLSSTVMLIVGFVVTTVACGPGYIAGTKVEASPENREIYRIVQVYRRAMEQRNTDKLDKLASRRYYENASTTDSNKDDYGYDTLKAKAFPELRDNVKKIQYRIKVNKIAINGNRASADYEYFWRFLYTEGGRDNWEVKNDFNRLEFVREGGSWKIIAGM